MNAVMNVLILSCLLAATTIVRAEQNENIIEKYLEYLMPEIVPCNKELGLTDEEIRNVQKVSLHADMTQLGCLRACVMKRMDALKDLKIEVGPIYKMIETVHAGDAAEIERLKNIANECIEPVNSETNECLIGLNYADCYIQKFFS